MKKVAVFGNPGGGKNTQSKRNAEVTGLPLYALDIIQFRGKAFLQAAAEGQKR
jgi:adenylate kinase family enzyme